MSKYVFFVTSSLASVTNLETGEVTQFFKGDTQYERAVELIKAGDYVGVEMLSTKNVLNSAIKTLSSTDNRIKIEIENNVGTLTINASGYKTTLNNVLVDRIVEMVSEGFDVQYMVNFISNLYQNPSLTAVNELFLFLENSQLPITEDGHFIAYKIVREDYKDVYTGTMDNSVGNIVSMLRNEVDDNRNNTCSRGLHFCSREYLSHYGSHNPNNDRCVLVKINPANVVSIPSDYNNAKGRTWCYEVVGEVSGKWRDSLPSKDYTDSPVVDTRGNDIGDCHNIDEISDIIDNSQFYYETNSGVWYIYEWEETNRNYVADTVGLSISELMSYEQYISGEEF